MLTKALLFPVNWLTSLRGRGSQEGAEEVRVSIRAKITLPYILLALMLAAGAAYVVTQIVFDSIEERFTNQLIEGGLLASEWVVREEDRLLETLRLLAYTQGVAGSLKDGDAEGLREMTFGVVVNNQEEAVEFLDAGGKIVLSMRHKDGGRIEEYDFVTGGEGLFAESDFVQDVLAGKIDHLGDKYAGYIQSPAGDYFYVSGPIYDQEEVFVGVVLIGKRLSTFVRQIRQETLAQVTLYNFQGKTVASTFNNPDSLPAEKVAEILSRQDDATLRRELAAPRDLEVGNIEYAQLLEPWEIRGDVDLGLMGVALPKTFLVTASNLTRIKVFALVSLAFALVMVMGVKIANFITQPIIGLVEASSEVAHGNLAVRVQASSHDEVALLSRSFNHMVGSLQQSKDELLQAYNNTIVGWSRALDLRDKETEGHSQRVTELTVQLAREMGFSEEELVQVRRGALLHDIGKMGIPDGILLKPGRLTDEEWEIMRRHPVYAYEMLWPIEYLRPALDIPYCHHERWDGTGYPRGLKGEEIPLAARIFAVVDVWDAMRSDRPYRAAIPAAEVLDQIQKSSGRHFDPQVVQIFLQLMRPVENRVLADQIPELVS